MQLTPMDDERIRVYRSLFAYVVRVFYEDVEIAVMDCALHHYFTNFVFETRALVKATELTREMVSRALEMFKTANLISRL